MKRTLRALFYAFLFLMPASLLAQTPVTLGTGTSYTENFNGIGTGLPNGFGIFTGSNTTSLGTAGTFINTVGSTTLWNATGAGFKNYASANGLTSAATSTEQGNATDRALGVRQTSSTGYDPGAAFVFQAANTTGKKNFQLSFKLQSLDATSPRVTTWVVSYALGGNGASATTATAVGTVTTGGSTFSNNTVTVDFGSALDNSSQTATIRIYTSSATTGASNRASSAIDDFTLSWTNIVTITAPTATTGNVTAKTSTTATLPGNVNDNGAATTVSFDYNAGSSIGGTPTNVAGTPGSVSAGAGATPVTAAITGLSPNTQYAYRVNGVNSAGTTNGTALTFFTAPAAPVLSAATAVTATGFTVNWGAVTGADSYLLDLSTENTFTTGLLSGYTGLSVTGTSQAVSGLTPSTTYYYRVRAVSNANGTGDNSAAASQATNAAVFPTISANGTLTALSTITGSASSNTTFTVSGTNLTGNVTVTAPVGFEVSTSATTGFGSTATLTQTGGAVPSTTVYVRLAAADAVGSYSGNVVLTSSGATTVNVATVSSTVNAMPVINTTGTLAALTATTGSASSNTSFSASGTNLTADITVTAPTGFEVSTSATTGFGTSTTLTQTGGNVPATTVYVRLSAGDAVGSYSGNVALTSTNATTVNVATANSTVIAAAVINAAGTLSALTTSSGKASSITSFSAAGSNLTADITVTAPTGFEVSTSATTGFAGTITLPQTGGSVASTTVYVRLAAADAGGSYSGNIVLTSAGAVAVNVATVSSFVFGTAVETISMNAMVQTYGNPDFVPATSNNSAVPIVYTSDNASVATIVSGKVHIVSAGTANITATQAGDATYAAATSVTAPLTVTRAFVTVTPDNQTRVLGAANPTLTASYSGLVNGETSAVFTTQPTIVTTANATSVPGNYPITASGAAAANYNFQYRPGVFVVTATPTYASLSSLTFSTGTLSPAFDPATLTYTNFINNSNSTATITAVAGDPAATVSINGVTGTGALTGALSLVVGNNNLIIVVTSRDGSTKVTYNVNAMRGAATVAANQSIASNVLSPNGDGQNDAWVVKDIASYPNNKVTVFDGAGRIVYSKVNYTNDWAGTVNGSPLAEGTYYYAIDLGQNIPIIKGYITIVRNRK